MKKLKGGMTAEEAMAILQADPQWVAERAKQDEEHQRRVEAMRQEEAPVVVDLQAAGFAVVDSAWDLRDLGVPYPKALPILLDHLQRSYSDDVRALLASMLSVPEARSFWSELLRLYRDERGEQTKDALANVIAAIADESRLGEVISLVRDQKNGSSRLLLLCVLERSADRRARATLMELGTDPELRKEIRVILRRLKRPRR